MDVNAFICAPIASISSEIPYAVRFSVPLNIICSIKCEIPSSASVSTLAPVWTIIPIDTDISPGICLTISLVPFPNVLLCTITLLNYEIQ